MKFDIEKFEVLISGLWSENKKGFRNKASAEAQIKLFLAKILRSESVCWVTMGEFSKTSDILTLLEDERQVRLKLVSSNKPSSKRLAANTEIKLIESLKRKIKKP